MNNLCQAVSNNQLFEAIRMQARWMVEHQQLWDENEASNAEWMAGE